MLAALSAGSFVWYRSVRFVMRRLVVLNARVNRRKTHQWHVLSAETLDQPLALLALMTSGPRWNPHAVIAGAGPIAIRGAITVDLEPLHTSAKSWTLVVYTFPDQRTVAHVGNLQGPFSDRWYSIALPPGRYSLALRYYHWSETIRLPDIQADGTPAIPSRAVPSHHNDFCEDLRKRRSRLYLSLHYYVYDLLRGTLRLPGVSVEREFLPMGNPETTFRYGAVAQRESLRVSVPQSLLATHDVYLTLYSRDSFPSRWYQIQEPHHLSAPAAEDGFYLLRIHQRLPAPVVVAADVQIETLAADARHQEVRQRESSTN